MPPPDDIARINRAYWEAEAEKRGPYAAPWLDLDVTALRDYSAGKASTFRLPPWMGGAGEVGPCDRIVMTDIAGKNVLCLASGGGQQSAVFGLLGAQVTVLDLTEGQLASDRQAADHYGYDVQTVSGDMRDLSPFDDASFDLVYQAISICFVPEVREVYAEVARILTPAGWYRVGHCNPTTCPTSFEGPANGWDGTGYRISEPYGGGPTRIDADGNENMREGKMTGELRHLLSDIFNGLIESGLVIRGVWEAPRHLHHDPSAEPGSEAHHRNVVADYFHILARKP